MHTELMNDIVPFIEMMSSKFTPEDMQQQIIKETFQLVSKRDDNVCNFLEGGRYV
ncbi:unnamed protein product [Acanthoscelides obtectus]|uniref:Uncharacterized protein n=1 Tax=Acanthoscelides obtectus TaxID=200917 RepID=A0A9P0QEF4_ACAOB|nr:unnamed protein product [Acanthoscelides obtectus]CAK1682664.1 AP-3 complex subunit sigma-2 [Acanthoscelides obtectus]